MRKPITQLIYAAFFIAFGVVLPQIFHAMGLGSVFLPMHIPVLMAGFFVAWPYALAVGVITPLLSFAFTGMPPVPMLFIMMFELAAYAVMVSIMNSVMSEKRNEIFEVYSALVVAMIAGRIVACVVTFVLARAFSVGNFVSFSAWASGSVVKGLPGIGIQLIFIPIVVPLENACYS